VVQQRAGAGRRVRGEEKWRRRWTGATMTTESGKGRKMIAKKVASLEISDDLMSKIQNLDELGRHDDEYHPAHFR
jgi:hypothetical protein